MSKGLQRCMLKSTLNSARFYPCDTPQQSALKITTITKHTKSYARSHTEFDVAQNQRSGVAKTTRWPSYIVPFKSYKAARLLLDSMKYFLSFVLAKIQKHYWFSLENV